MELQCNVDLIKRHELTPTSYFFLLYLYTEEPFPWELPQQNLKVLESAGWIKIMPEKVVLRSKFKTTFKKYVSSYDVADWIEDWRKLWPAGVKTFKRIVRGDKQGVLKKMKAFLKQYPEYTKEEIFEATQIYVFEKQRENYKAMSCADYFIEKEGLSQLAAYLEDIEGKDAILTQINGGGSAFHKEV